MEIILPVLDTEALQKKANEFAMLGAIKTLEEFYTGYNSPYRKAIEDKLKEQKLKYSFDLPDILGVLNDSLSKEIDIIANKALASSFLPLVKKILLRAPKEIKFSEVLKSFIEEMDAEHYEDVEIEMVLNEQHKWYNVELRHKDSVYTLTLHQTWDSKKTGPAKYSFLSLPHSYEKRGDKMMCVSMEDGSKVEIPFSYDILKDKFCAYIATLLMADTEITIDQKEFDEDMFPEKCHC